MPNNCYNPCRNYFNTYDKKFIGDVKDPKSCANCVYNINKDTGNGELNLKQYKTPGPLGTVNACTCKSMNAGFNANGVF